MVYNWPHPHIGHCAGLGIPALLKAVTQLLPLDAYVPKPVINAQTDFSLI